MSTEPPASGGQSPIPDEDWERFAREAESGAGGQVPKEPSARQRMVTERLRQLDADAAARAGGRRGGLLKRKGKKAAPAEPWQPDGWRTGPAWQEMNGKKRRGRRLRAGLGVLVVAGLALVAVNPSLVTSRLPEALGGTTSDGSAEPVSAEPLPAETAAPTAAPGEAPPGTPTLDDPFRGSPAAGYADGADGIVLPEAKPVGRMSEQQVAVALEAARDFLVDANLDPATLRGERPETALARLDAANDPFVADVESWLEKPGEESDPTMLFSRFDPDEVKPAGDVVKTRGRMTFDEGRDGSVRVHADYTFVYPVVKAAEGSTEVARTIVRRVVEFESYDPAVTQATGGRLWFSLYNVDVGNDDCRVTDGYLHPQFDSDLLRAAPPASGPAVDPYDRSRDLDAEDTGNEDGACGTVTRT